MNKREKILAGAAGLVVVILVTYVAVYNLCLEPARRADQEAQELVGKLERAKTEKMKEGSYKKRLKALADQSFGTDELKVTEQIRTVVTGVLALSGLSAQNLSLKPLSGSRVPGVYREIGWTVRARGKLPQVVNFLYLLAKEAHLHRLDNVVLTPVAGTAGDVELQVKYATLLLEAPKGEKLIVEGMPDAPFEAGVLESAARQQYNVIAARNLFLPYIPAQPKPPEAPSRSDGPRVAERPTPEGRMRVVGLPTWGGRTDVLVRDAGSGKVASFKPGDDLAGGKIVMVDYRLMPLPSKPEFLSGSRVVLLVGSQYYAVELGQSLAEKRVLAPADVPAELPKLETPAPAAASPPGPVSSK
jgi:hypothetical protein